MAPFCGECGTEGGVSLQEGEYFPLCEACRADAARWEEELVTPEWVESRVAGIRRQAERHRDAEAHIDEDHLREKVLRGIAEGRCEHAAECARLALTTEELKFARWYE